MTVPLNTSLVVRCVRCECGGDSDASVVSVEVSAAGDVGALRAAVASELQRATCCSVEPASGGERVQLFVRCGASEAEELAPLNSDELPLQEIAFPSLASGAVEVYYSVEEEHCFGYTSCYYNGYYYSNCCYQSGSYVPCWVTTTEIPLRSINRNYYYACFAIAGVAIIGALIYMFIKRRNRMKAQQQQQQQVVAGAEEPVVPAYAAPGQNYGSQQNGYYDNQFGNQGGAVVGVPYGSSPPNAGYGYGNYAQNNYGDYAPAQGYNGYDQSHQGYNYQNSQPYGVQQTYYSQGNTQPPQHVAPL